jgi:hypothetical protein
LSQLTARLGDDNYRSLCSHGLRPTGRLRCWDSHRRTSPGTYDTSANRSATGQHPANCNRSLACTRDLRPSGTILSWDFRRRTSLSTCGTSASCADRDHQLGPATRSSRSHSSRVPSRSLPFRAPRPCKFLRTLPRIDPGTSCKNANLFEPYRLSRARENTSPWQSSLHALPTWLMQNS